MKSNKLKELLINSKTISFTIIIIVGVLAWVGNQQMKSYEDSILSIYAEQQDAYVQLVLDQINVLDDRSDEEIVTKILGSLDASSRKYWTLTKNKALLFVKVSQRPTDIRDLHRIHFFPETVQTIFYKIWQ